MEIEYKVEFLHDAINNLRKLDKPIAQRILNKINWLSENFDYITPQPLTADFKKMYKLRAGDWRIIYTVDLKEHLIKIHMIDHRKDIYKK